MEKIALTYLELAQFMSNPLYTEGSEGILSIYDNNNLIKIYHHYDQNRIKHLLMLEEISKEIKKTSFVHKTAYLNNILTGSIIPYYKDYHCLEELSKYNVPLVYNVLLSTLNNIKELTENNLYLPDLDGQNVLFNTNSDVQIIDTDGDGIIYSNNKKELLNTLKLYNNTILEILYPLYKEYGTYDVLREYFISEEFITTMKKEQYTYDYLEELIKYSE